MFTCHITKKQALIWISCLVNYFEQTQNLRASYNFQLDYLYLKESSTTQFESVWNMAGKEINTQ